MFKDAKRTSFAVGDKVKIHNCEGGSEYNGKIGTVIVTDRVKRIGGRWDYLCSFEDLRDYPFGLAEMEPFIKVGEQLLLFEL